MDYTDKTNEHIMVSSEVRSVMDVIKDFMVQDKRREADYVHVLQEQIEILKNELRRNEFMLNEQLLIIKQPTQTQYKIIILEL